MSWLSFLRRLVSRDACDNLKLTQLTKALGYPGERGGVCFGSATMAMQPILLEDEDAIRHFNARMKILRTFDFSKYKEADKTEVEAALKKHYEKTVTSKDTKEIQAGWIDLLAFLDGLIVSHSLTDCKKIWEEDLPLLEHQQQNAQSALLFSASLALAETTAISDAGNIHQLAHFSGIYDHAELQIYFKSLDKTLREERSTAPFCLLLTSVDHAILVGSYTKKGQRLWFFFDANGALHKQKAKIISVPLDGLADLIFPALFAKDVHVVFSTELYTLNKHQAMQQPVIQKWMGQLSWKSLHAAHLKKSKRVDSNQVSWLIVAARNGQEETVESLLKAGAQASHTSDEGLSSLFLATANGYTSTVNLLLQHGANPHQTRGEDGTSSLLLAVEQGYTDIAKLLIDAGANPHQKHAHHDTTPFSRAVVLERIEILALLLQSPNIHLTEEQKNDLLWNAVKNEQLDIVKHVLALNGIDLNQKRNKSTLLFEAIMQGNIEMVKLLLNAGANPEFVDDDGTTPPLIAITYGYIDIMQLFLERGIHPDQSDHDGASLLWTAVAQGKLNFIQLFLAHGADPLKADKKGMTPLNLAEQYYTDLAAPLREAITQRQAPAADETAPKPTVFFDDSKPEDAAPDHSGIKDSPS